MATLPLSIQVTAQTAQAARAVGQLQQQLGGVNTAARNAGNANPFGGITSSAGSAKLAIAGVLAGLAAVAGAATTAFKTLGKGFSTNSQIEDTTLGVKGLLAALYEVRDASGQVVDGQDALTIAGGEASRQMTALRIAGMQTTATFAELSAAFQAALSAGAGAGFNPDQVRDLTVGLVQAAGALGVAADQMKSEINALFSGEISADADIAKKLGITRENVQEWRAAGADVFYDQLNERLRIFKMLGDEAASTWSGTISNAADAVDLLAGKVTEGAFATLKQGIQAALGQVFDTSTAQVSSSLEGLIATASRVFNAIATFAADALGGAVSAAQQLSAWLLENSDTVNDLLDAGGALYDVFKSLLSTVGDLLGALGGGASVVDVLAAAVKVVAYLVAGITDGVKILGAAFVAVGSHIADSIGRPLARVLGGLQDFLAKIPGIGSSLANAVGSIVRAIPQNGEGMRQYAKGVVEDFKNGKSAVQSLNAELAKTTAQREAERKAAEAARKQQSKAGTLGARPGGGAGPGAGTGAKAAAEKAARELAAAQRAYDLAEIDAAKRQADALRYVQEGELAARLQTFQVSQQDYLRAQARFAQQGLEAERQALQARQALLKRDLAAAPDAAARTKVQAELLKLKAELDALESRERIINVKLNADLSDVERQVRGLEVDLRARILDAQGQDLQASLARLGEEAQSMLENPLVAQSAQLRALVAEMEQASRTQLEMQDRAARASLRAALEVDILADTGEPLQAALTRIREEARAAFDDPLVRNSPELAALAKRRAALAEEKALADEQVRIAQDRRSTLTTIETEVQRMVERGQLSTAQGEKAVQAARLATAASVLETVEALEKLAEASDNPAIVESARAARREYEAFAEAARKTADATFINRGAADGVRSLLNDLREGVSASDALRNALGNLFDSLADRYLDQLATDIFNSLQGSAGQGIGGAMSRAMSEGIPEFVGNLQGALSGLGDWLSGLLSGGGGGGGFMSWLSGLGGFASGGYTGAGGKYAPAGIVHRGEFVLPQEAVRKLGLPFLYSLMSPRFSRASLPGFSSGGLVGGGLQGAMAGWSPTIRSEHTSNTVLQLDGAVVARQLGKTSEFERQVMRATKGRNGSQFG